MAVNFIRDALVLLMMLPVSAAANQVISHVCVSRTQDINQHLLRLSFLSHRLKNRILLALPLVSNLLWLTAYYITFRFISWWTRALRGGPGRFNFPVHILVDSDANLKPDPERLQALFDLTIPSLQKS